MDNKKYPKSKIENKENDKQEFPIDKLDVNKRVNKRRHELKFEKLFKKYSPIVKALWANYYVVGMDYDDWNQKAQIVLLNLMYRFHRNGRFTFGTYYRMALKNRMFDLIRKSNAQKRKPREELTCLNSFSENYTEILIDKRANNPEAKLLMEEKLQDALNNNLSYLEARVFKLHLMRKNII